MSKPRYVTGVQVLQLLFNDGFELLRSVCYYKRKVYESSSEVNDLAI